MPSTDGAKPYMSHVDTRGPNQRNRLHYTALFRSTNTLNPFGCKQKELPMNWAMPCTESRIGTATAAAALIALSALIDPAHALATPTPINLSFQTENNKLGMSLAPVPVRRGHDGDR